MFFTNERDGPSHHHVWSFLWLTYLRVGFWYQHIWFGSWGPNWFYRITNQEQLCGFLTRVSSLDFCPWWSFWSLLRCLQKMYNWDSPWQDFAFVVTQSTCDSWSTSRSPFCLGFDVWFREEFPAAGLVGVLVLFNKRNTSITTSHKSTACSPSSRNPTSNEMISDSVELWDTDVCFLHIQLIVTNVRLPKIHKIHPEVDFESSKSPAKTESWNNPIDNAQPCYPHDNEINLAKRLSQAWVHFVTSLASLLTDHKKCQVSQYEPKYRHFRTICEQIVDNSPTDPFSSSLNWWSSMHGVATL